MAVAADTIWNRILMLWVAILLIEGTANIFVFTYFTTTTWVSFKIFGLLTISLIGMGVTIYLLNKYGKIREPKNT